MLTFTAGCEPTVYSDLDGLTLRIEEVHAWSITDPAAYRGGAILSDSTALLLREDGSLDRFDRGAVEPMRLAGVGGTVVFPTQALRPEGGSDLFGVVRGTGRKMGLSPAGYERLDAVPCPQLVGLDAVASSAQGMLALVPHADGGSWRVVVATSGTDTGDCGVVEGPGWRCAGGFPSVVESLSSGWLLACGDPLEPLWSVEREYDSLVVTPLAHSAPSASPAQGVTLSSRWMGLPLLRLDVGYLRVVSDLRSDTRRLEVWDRKGIYWRSQVVDAPLGLVASRPGGRLLLGLRGSTSFELVLFRWSWDIDR